MSNLTVSERDSVLVVDSRLIAPRLGIEHRSFVKTIDRYREQITSVSDKPEDQVLRFEISKPPDNSKGGRPERFVYLTDAQASFVMTLSRNTPQVVEFKRQLVRAFEKAKQVIKEVIPPQNQEIERMKLELELIRAKQHYQDTSYAIVLSTSPAVLEWLRGDTPRPKELVYRDRFLDATGHEVGSSSGRSLTQLIADAGLNPKSTKDRQTIKKILKCHGFDYDRRQGWSTASYLREYPVLEDNTYSLALKAVLGEVLADEQAPNLFIHSLQQKAISPHKQPQSIQGLEEP